MNKPRLFKSRFIKPYKDDGSTNLLFCKGKAGVYQIQDENGETVYVGYSGTNLYKTVLRHFQSWEDKTQIRVYYQYKKSYKVRIVITTPERAEKLERALIVALKPKDNPNKLKAYIPTPYEEDIQREWEKAPAKNWTEMEDAPF